MTEPTLCTALEQAALIRCGSITSVELVTSQLARIEKHNPILRAFVTVAGESALAAAHDADTRVADGAEAPFLGVPIAIKDVVDAAGVRTTYSSRAFATNVPRKDAAVVRRIRHAGLVVVGKTNVPEFGLTGDTISALNGACLNPWDLARSPGGSSGGSAAAVACGLVAIAHGTDGGGSIRAPASCCGVVGIKPSRGRVTSSPSTAGVLNGLVTDGVLSRDVRDCAAALDAIAGTESEFRDAVDRPLRTLRIGVVRESPAGSSIAPDCLAALDLAVDILTSLGHTVVEARPMWPKEGAPLSRVGAASMAYYDTTHRELFESETQALLSDAESVNCVEYLRAVLELERQGDDFLRSCTGTDFLLTPTLAAPPMPSGWLTAEPDTFSRTLAEENYSPFTAIANFTGQPAISLPIWWTSDGLPIGVQLIGMPGTDGELLTLAAAVERVQPWLGHWPAL